MIIHNLRKGIFSFFFFTKFENENTTFFFFFSVISLTEKNVKIYYIAFVYGKKVKTFLKIDRVIEGIHLKVYFTTAKQNLL